MKAYWDILRELREDHDLTQAQVAAVIGTTQQVYYRYEKGINELPLHHLQVYQYGIRNKQAKKRRCITCKHYALITMSALTIFLACRRDCAGRAEGLFFELQLLVANFSTPLGGLFARLLVS